MRRSITGPLIMLFIGGLFLWRNFHPEVPVFDLLSQYWPFLLDLLGPHAARSKALSTAASGARDSAAAKWC